MSKVISARELVMNRLMRRVRAFPDLEIAPLVTEGLAPRDASLAWAIDQAVSRRWMSLLAVLQVHLSRPWERIEPGAQAALLAGAAQLVLMDRLPAYAVISESVDWTKRRVRPKAGGLVNAVLRRVEEMMVRSTIVESAEDREHSRREFPLEDGRLIVFDQDVFAEDSLQRLNQQTSHAPALVERWQERFGVEETVKLARHSIVVPPTIMTGVPATMVETRAGGGEPLLAPHDEPGFFVFHGGHADLTLLLASDPACRVQDPTAAKAVELTRELSPKTIIDMCAGRGTKTRQLAALHPHATIIASDVSQERIKVLRQVFVGSERVRVKGPGELDEHSHSADLVLCDVPCSNTGVLARRSEAKYRFAETHLRELVRMQSTIVNRAGALLAPSGVIVYSTCSIEDEENAAQVRAAAERHGMHVAAEIRALPAGRPGDASAMYHDGGYAAVLQRRGD
jgi:16S rRNA (cytosine967-C5)-methyltransferase